MITLYFIDNLSFWFFIFNSLQIKPQLSLLFYLYLVFMMHVIQNIRNSQADPGPLKHLKRKSLLKKLMQGGRY